MFFGGSFSAARSPPRRAKRLWTGFLELSLVRYPVTELRPRMSELRHNLTSYDATYVALAESVDATELLTADSRLAAAFGLRCVVTDLRPCDQPAGAEPA